MIKKIYFLGGILKVKIYIIYGSGLMEIRPVDNGCVAIKGIASSKFLCLERDGRLYGSVSSFFHACSNSNEQEQMECFRLMVSRTPGWPLVCKSVLILLQPQHSVSINARLPILMT